MAIDERELDDASLVDAAQHGDGEAFTELFRRHYPRVRRVCARKIGNTHEADEVAQAAFVRAYERIDQCGGDRRFGAWVQVIAFRLTADDYRRRARSTVAAEPVSGDIALGPNYCEDELLRAEQAAMVRDMLSELPHRQREVIIARDLEGRRPGEIAASLGLSVGAVDSLLLRARRRAATTWKSASVESGGATVSAASATASVLAASLPGPIQRALSTVADAGARLSYRIAGTIGVIPGSSPLVQRAAVIATAGALAVVPTATARMDSPSAVALPIAVALPAVPVPTLSTPRVAAPTVHAPPLTAPSVRRPEVVAPTVPVTPTPVAPAPAPPHAPAAPNAPAQPALPVEIAPLSRVLTDTVSGLVSATQRASGTTLP